MTSTMYIYSQSLRQNPYFGSSLNPDFDLELDLHSSNNLCFPLNPLECPYGWSRAGSRCYGVFRYQGVSGEDRTWRAARMRCVTYGSHLVTVKTCDGDDVITGLLKVTEHGIFFFPFQTLLISNSLNNSFVPKRPCHKMTYIHNS